MQYLILIQEHLDNGENFMHVFKFDKCCMDEAMEFKEKEYQSDCVFVLQYTIN